LDGIFTSEQTLFADAVAQFVDREYGRGPGRPSHGFDRGRFARLADLGCLSLAIPEEHGGFGGAVEAMIAARGLAPGLPHEPVIEAGIQAAAVLAACASDEAAAALLPGIADGTRLVVVAHGEDAQRYDETTVLTRAEPRGAATFLTGRKAAVPAASFADLLVVSASWPDGGLALFAVDPRQQGVTVERRRGLDGRDWGRITFDGCGAMPLAPDAISAAQALAAGVDHAEAAQVAAMVGLMEALNGAVIEYLRTRRQFGVPIGSFQALQHRVADMWMAAEETKSLALAAALACGGPAQDRRRVVSQAKLRACDAALLVGHEAIQMHGGIGMTDDLIVGHWVRRLHALRVSLGDRQHHLERLVSLGAEDAA
jgi:alkylation response protein AidB-like acyl-CoA dehydrogenase